MKYARSSLPQICIALEAVLLKLNTNLTPDWALISVNVDPKQEIRQKVGGGRTFMRLRYIHTNLQLAPPLYITNMPPKN